MIARQLAGLRGILVGGWGIPLIALLVTSLDLHWVFPSSLGVLLALGQNWSASRGVRVLGYSIGFLFLLALVPPADLHFLIGTRTNPLRHHTQADHRTSELETQLRQAAQDRDLYQAQLEARPRQKEHNPDPDALRRLDALTNELAASEEARLQLQEELYRSHVERYQLRDRLDATQSALEVLRASPVPGPDQDSDVENEILRLRSQINEIEDRNTRLEQEIRTIRKSQGGGAENADGDETDTRLDLTLPLDPIRFSIDEYSPTTEISPQEGPDFSRGGHVHGGYDLRGLGNTLPEPPFKAVSLGQKPMKELVAPNSTDPADGHSEKQRSGGGQDPR